MDFNPHYNLHNQHAFLSASSYAWTNYDANKLRVVWQNAQRKKEGTILHELASMNIQNRVKVAPLKKALNMFINDAIGMKMQSEQILYYSDYCFGTADAISFKKNHLQIHDLKTGVTKPSFRQLDVYAALFCLEYEKDPFKITIEERIYQGRGYEVNIPDPEEITRIMGLIVEFDKVLNEMENDI